MLCDVHPFDFFWEKSKGVKNITYTCKFHFPISIDLLKVIHDSLKYDPKERPSASDLIEYEFFSN